MHTGVESLMPGLVTTWDSSYKCFAQIISVYKCLIFKIYGGKSSCNYCI